MLFFNLLKEINKIEYSDTSYNRTVYASPPVGGSGSEKPQSGCALCAVCLHHILARRNATHCFMGGPKRHIQPNVMRHTTLKFFENYIKMNLTKYKIKEIILAKGEI
jgi:hypothetical protein